MSPLPSRLPASHAKVEQFQGERRGKRGGGVIREGEDEGDEERERKREEEEEERKE